MIRGSSARPARNALLGPMVVCVDLAARHRAPRIGARGWFERRGARRSPSCSRHRLCPLRARPVHAEASDPSTDRPRAPRVQLPIFSLFSPSDPHQQDQNRTVLHCCIQRLGAQTRRRRRRSAASALLREQALAWGSSAGALVGAGTDLPSCHFALGLAQRLRQLSEPPPACNRPDYANSRRNARSRYATGEPTPRRANRRRAARCSASGARAAEPLTPAVAAPWSRSRAPSRPRRGPRLGARR